ncbi:MAG: cation:proton antiporter subunit C [Verrucomicrobia bacterium]|nr:cation:proton antiporter subunit C [Verrucomicrobiota bacterium]
MSQYQLYAVGAVLLFCIGLQGIIVCRHLLKKVMAANIMGGGAFLFLISIARRNTIETADPVPHAMVLTGIVIALSASVLALALTRQIHKTTGHTTLEDPTNNRVEK